MLVIVSMVGKADDLSSPVKLELKDCAQGSSGEVDRILDLELQSIFAGHHDITPRPTLVTVTCAPGRLSLVARDNTTGRFSNRVIQTDAHPPEGMERIIAIAAAELVLSTWEQLSSAAADTSPPSKSKDEPDARSASAAKHRAANGGSVGSVPESVPLARDKDRLSAALQVGALWRMYLNAKASSFGGEIGGNLDFPRLFRMHLGITPEGGKTDRPLGAALLFSVSAAFSLGVHGRLFSTPLQGGADIGFRGGYGRLRGRPQSPPSTGDTLSGGFGGPLLLLSLASATRPAVALSVETGYAVFGITGRVDVGSPVEIGGFWMSVQLNFILQQKLESDE